MQQLLLERFAQYRPPAGVHSPTGDLSGLRCGVLMQTSPAGNYLEALLCDVLALELEPHTGR